MAVIGGIVWEVRPTGGANNGGGFKADQASAGTDYSLQDAAQLSVTDLACANTTGDVMTVTSATGGFTAAMIGNVLCIRRSGFSLGGRVMITAVGSSNSITVNKIDTYNFGLAGSFSGLTGNVGGCLSNLYLLMGRTEGAATEQDCLPSGPATVWVKSGAYSSLDFFAQADGLGVGQGFHYEGYTTTRGDNAPTRPVLMLANGNFSDRVIEVVGNYNTFRHFVFDAAGLVNKVLKSAVNVTGVHFHRCAFRNSIKWGISDQNGRLLLTDFEVSGCGDTAMTVAGFPTSGGIEVWGVGSVYQNGVVSGNTGPGLYLDSSSIFSRVSVYGNAGPGVYVDAAGIGFSSLLQCTLDRNTLDGVLLAGANVGANLLLYACAITNNGGYGIRSTIAVLTIDLVESRVLRCAFYNNTLGAVSNAQTGENAVILTAEPWISGAAGNLEPNDDAGGGAELWAASLPLNLDIGALQHTDPVSGTPAPSPGDEGDGLAIATIQILVDVEGAGTGSEQTLNRKRRISIAAALGNGKRESVSLTGATFTALSPPTGAKAVAITLPAAALSVTLKGITGDGGVVLTPASGFAAIPAIIPLGASPSIGLYNAGSTVIIEVLWL